jgi:hypothetical protein
MNGTLATLESSVAVEVPAPALSLEAPLAHSDPLAVVGEETCRSVKRKETDWCVGRDQKCVEFILEETKGNWHGRARAVICPRLKHCDVEQARQPVSCITLVSQRATSRSSFTTS